MPTMRRRKSAVYFAWPRSFLSRSGWPRAYPPWTLGRDTRAGRFLLSRLRPFSLQFWADKIFPQKVVLSQFVYRCSEKSELIQILRAVVHDLFKLWSPHFLFVTKFRRSDTRYQQRFRYMEPRTRPPRGHARHNRAIQRTGYWHRQRLHPNPSRLQAPRDALLIDFVLPDSAPPRDHTHRDGPHCPSARRVDARSYHSPK
jgi:hypothetical protein